MIYDKIKIAPKNTKIDPRVSPQKTKNSSKMKKNHLRKNLGDFCMFLVNLCLLLFQCVRQSRDLLILRFLLS
jgi:hypothetical protein